MSYVPTYAVKLCLQGDIAAVADGLNIGKPLILFQYNSVFCKFRVLNILLISRVLFKILVLETIMGFRYFGS